jgi:hypothetical protein
MKKLFSILFASLILLSGLHLTVASHLCCGELAAVKYSFTGEKASCGMEDEQSATPVNGKVKGICCENNIASCSTDNNYFSSTTIVKEITQEISPVCDLLPEFIIPAPALFKTYHSMVGPPVSTSFNAVDLSFICVFIC